MTRAKKVPKVSAGPAGPAAKREMDAAARQLVAMARRLSDTLRQSRAGPKFVHDVENFCKRVGREIKHLDYDVYRATERQTRSPDYGIRRVADGLPLDGDPA
jgi:hypothetical protein